LMATALLATACGGGGGGDAAPAPAGPPAGTPAPAGNGFSLADIEACPTSEAIIDSTNWYTACLVGKTLKGKDPITSEACELRLKPNGVFEYAKNGVVISTTPPISQWEVVDGTYSNYKPVGSDRRFFGAKLSGEKTSSAPSNLPTIFYKIDIKIQATSVSTDLAAVEFRGPNALLENCKLNSF
jgi:hypothetical protein